MVLNKFPFFLTLFISIHENIFDKKKIYFLVPRYVFDRYGNMPTGAETCLPTTAGCKHAYQAPFGRKHACWPTLPR
jgi:hypothetical protein